MVRGRLYACAGRVLNYAGVSALTPAELSGRASRVLRFIDMGGHERYLKTAIYGASLLLACEGCDSICPLPGGGTACHHESAMYPQICSSLS